MRIEFDEPLIEITLQAPGCLELGPGDWVGFDALVVDDKLVISGEDSTWRIRQACCERNCHTFTFLRAPLVRVGGPEHLHGCKMKICFAMNGLSPLTLTLTLRKCECLKGVCCLMEILDGLGFAAPSAITHGWAGSAFLEAIVSAECADAIINSSIPASRSPGKRSGTVGANQFGPISRTAVSLPR